MSQTSTVLSPHRAQTTQPHVTVVIATCASPARVLRCVRSVQRSSYLEWDVVVAENRPQRSSVRRELELAFPGDARISVVDVALPGLSRARNAGLAVARGEYVAFIDDDIVVSPGWMSAIVRAFVRTQADCVTGRISAASLASVQEAWFEQLASLEKGDTPELFTLGPGAVDRGLLFPYTAGAIGSGASIAVRADAAREIRGFDPTLGAGTPSAGGEDLDFFVRLLVEGHSIYYEPRATVSHEHPAEGWAVRLRAFRYGLGLTAMLAAQLANGPRRPLLRAIPAGLRYLRDPQSRKNSARGADYPRSLLWLEVLGLVLGPLAWLRSAAGQARRAGGPDRPAPLERSNFVAATAQAIDLDSPIAGVSTARRADGSHYGALLALVRLHGDPLTALEIPLRAGAADAETVANAIWDAAEPEIHRHVETHGCAQASDIRRERLDSGFGHSCSERLPDRAALPFVTVIVPSAKRPERIPAVVRSLAGLDYPHFEILVVDNFPADPRTREQVQECARAGLPVRYAAEALPGSSVARNRGMRETTSDLLAFTDDDVAVDPDWLTWMVKPFLEDPSVGVVTGLVMPARYETPEQRRFEELSGFGKGFDRVRYDRRSPLRSERLLYPYWGAVFGSGNSMAFRREALEEIGGLDPALGAGSPARAGSDIESFSHAVLNGHCLVYEPRAVCWHDHRTTQAALMRQTFNYGVGCTAILTKWALRDPRLWVLALRQSLTLLLGRLGLGAQSAVPYELERLRRQVGAAERKQMTRRQLAGFAVGPVFYLRSLLWSRRQRMREVFPARRPLGHGR